MYSVSLSPAYDKGVNPVATLVCPLVIVVYIPLIDVPSVVSNELTVIVV